MAEALQRLNNQKWILITAGYNNHQRKPKQVSNTFSSKSTFVVYCAVKHMKNLDCYIFLPSYVAIIVEMAFSKFSTGADVLCFSFWLRFSHYVHLVRFN